MKKLTATAEDISFKVNGDLTLDITKEGVIVDDAVAKVVTDRLGAQVSCEEASVKEAAKAASDANADAPTKITKDTTEEQDKALALAAGVTEEEYAAEVEAATTDGEVDAKALKKSLTVAIKAKAA